MKLFLPLLLLPPCPVKADEPVTSREEVYKQVGDLQLTARIYERKNSTVRKRPAIIFFFGGGWRNGSVNQFRYQSEYLARHGMVAIVPDYRVSSRHMTAVVDCVADAKSAVRWARTNARRLGIDPDRIAAGGGSAGGHLGGSVDQLSPQQHLRPDLPATIIFHGQADVTIPYQTVEKYLAAARSHGNRCELVGYDEADHGFFNFGRDGNHAFIDTMQRSHRFLAELGYLSAEPDVVDFVRNLNVQRPAGR